jgi:FkbM family methyltransferase
MNKIRLAVIRMLQGLTSVVQIKGVPKFIIYTKNTLFRKDQEYKVYNDIRIKIDPTVNFHCLNVLNYGGYETIKIFEKYLEKGDVYVDVGANLGYMSINAEKIVGPGGAVVALEPDTEILTILKANKLINHSAFPIIEKAASEAPGVETFNIATESGLSRLSNVQHNLFGLELLRQKEVETDSLDNILNSIIPNRPVKLIKIDVEGHELRVLKGAVNTINNYKPVLILEINHGALKQNDISYLDILHFLEKFSYKFYFVDSHSADWLRFKRAPTFRPIRNYHEDFINKPFDLLCIGPDLN